MRRRFRRLRIAALVALLATLAFVALAATATLSSNGGIALLEPTAQGVFARTAGASADVRVASSLVLRAGDSVRTDATGHALIAYADGTILVVGPNSQLMIDVSASGPDLFVLITQNAGRVWYQISQSLSPGLRYEVHSGSLAAVVRAGSIVQVEVTDEGANVTAAVGAVDTTSRGETVVVTSGNGTIVKPDSTPAPLVPSTATPAPLPAPLYQWPTVTAPTAAPVAVAPTPTPGFLGTLPLPTIPAPTSAPTPAPAPTATPTPTAPPSSTPPTTPPAMTPPATTPPPTPTQKTHPTPKPKGTLTPAPTTPAPLAIDLEALPAAISA